MTHPINGALLGEIKLSSPKSNILLNNQVLEEVETYKYLGEVFNNKGNMEAHIKAIEGKIHAATQNIITETGNKEFKGMKMQAIWQMVEATIIPILTYGAEGWSLRQKEERQIQSAFTKVLKTILELPMATPNYILLAETGFLPTKPKTSYSYGYSKTKCMKRTNVIHSGGTNNQWTPTNVLLTNHVQNSLHPNHS